MAEVDVYAEAEQAAASENAFLDAITGIAQPLATASPGEPSSLSPSAPFNVFFGRVSFVPSLFGSPQDASTITFATVGELTRRCSSATCSVCFSIEEVGPFGSGFLSEKQAISGSVLTESRAGSRHTVVQASHQLCRVEAVHCARR